MPNKGIWRKKHISKTVSSVPPFLGSFQVTSSSIVIYFLKASWFNILQTHGGSQKRKGNFPTGSKPKV